jgi:hypothetical protein
MGNFLGGSAYAMSQQVSDGFVLVTDRMLRRLSVGEREQLGFELDKLMRDLRGDQPALDDLEAIRKRNRRIQRLSSCRQMMASIKQQR